MHRYKLELTCSGTRFAIPGVGEDMCVIATLVDLIDGDISRIAKLLNTVKFDGLVPDNFISDAIAKIETNFGVYKMYSAEGVCVILKLHRQHTYTSIFGTLM